MKKKLLFIFIIILSSITIVNADCTKEEISSLQKEARKIKITYKHLGGVEGIDGGIYYNSFSVNIKNIPDDFYVILDGVNRKYIPENNTVFDTLDNGKWTFSFYSNSCNSKISTIAVKLPRFNTYSLDPLCEGIDGNEFQLCGKYYEYNVSYDDFKLRVENYRKTHKIIKEEEKKEEKSIEEILSNILSFIQKYKLYFIAVAVLFIIVVVVLIIIRKNRKRGVLR